MSTKPGLAPSRRPAENTCRRRTASATGVSQTLIGHPPDPVVACTNVMYTRSTSGRSSRSTLIETKSTIEDLGDLCVLEALVLHHVAPVAGRVADGQEDRLVLAARPLEGLRAPRVPVNRIVLVLKEIRTVFSRETIRHVIRFWQSQKVRFYEQRKPDRLHVGRTGRGDYTRGVGAAGISSGRRRLSRA